MSDKIVHVTDGSFEDDVLKAEDPVLVDYWAEWCGPCKAIAPILGEIAEEYAGRVKIAKLNIDENPSTRRSTASGDPDPDALQGRQRGSDEGRRPLEVPALGVSRQQHLIRTLAGAPGRCVRGYRRTSTPAGEDRGVSGGRCRNTVVALPFNGGVRSRRALQKASQPKSSVDLPASRASAFVRVIPISPRCTGAT